MGVSLTKRIIDILIGKNLISEQDLERSKKWSEENDSNLGEALISLGIVSKEDLLTTLSEELNIPPINISSIHIDQDVIKLITKKTAFTYGVFPLSVIGKQLTVAMVDPLNIFTIDDLKVLTGLNISPVLTTEDDIQQAIIKYYEKSAHEQINEIMDNIKTTEMKMLEDEEEFDEDLVNISEDAPVVKLTNMLLSRAVKERASDILVEPMDNKTRIRYRIDGVFCERFTTPKKYHQAIISRLKVMSELDIAERRLPQDGRFRIKYDSREIDFRISTVPSSFGEKIALRILDKGQATIDINKLGFSSYDIEKMQAAGKKPHGMILVCGPTGCGKTTTLYSVLKYVDDPGKNIVTVEDPVEYEMKGFNQVSINDEVGLTFAGCLRSILRQDPDIIMVGEIRDFETLDVSIKSALTGHLVLSTLHTNTACGSIVRMVNMGVEPFLIASSVEIVAAQRLIRCLCPECKVPYTPDEITAGKYGIYDENGKIPTIYKPGKCKRCFDTGYKGRLGIIECLVLTPEIKDLIFKRAEEAEIEKVAKDQGMVSLRDNGIKNVIKGLTSLEDVLRVTIGSDVEGE